MKKLLIPFLVLFLFISCTEDKKDNDTVNSETSSEMTMDTEVKAQTTCPVMGGAINKEMYADVNGKRIYVCCQACIETIKANPEKYIKQMEADGIMLEDIPEE